MMILNPFQANGWRSIVIHQQEADDITVNLSDDLEMSFTPSHLMIKSENYNIEIPKANLRRITTNHYIDEIPTGISSPVKAGVYSLNGSSISFAVSSDVSVYRYDGALCISKKQCIELDLSSLPSAVYVIMVNGLSFKIIR